MIAALFWLSLFLLYYVYDGYLRVLHVASILYRPKESPSPPEPLPSVTVLVTVLNEAAGIVEKIRDVLEVDYPKERLEVLVASDGSTDGTDDLVRTYPDSRVRLFRPESRAGKSKTQNRAISQARGDILVFTDAETRFERGFLWALVEPFADPDVGGVDGHLTFIGDAESGVSKSQSVYWRYELKLRELESRLGILTVASGACLAVRLRLFRSLDGAFGEDCVVPLDVIEQGRLMRHAREARAFDRMEHEVNREFRTRVRMTLRNWQGTWSRPGLLNPLRYPGYAFSLWSHKILRWLSPVYLLLATGSAAALAPRSGFFRTVGIGLLVFYAAGLAGWILEKHDVRVPVLRTLFSFLLANAGFLVGLWQAARGRRITAYR